MKLKYAAGYFVMAIVPTCTLTLLVQHFVGRESASWVGLFAGLIFGSIAFASLEKH